MAPPTDMAPPPGDMGSGADAQDPMAGGTAPDTGGMQETAAPPQGDAGGPESAMPPAGDSTQEGQPPMDDGGANMPADSAGAFGTGAGEAPITNDAGPTDTGAGVDADSLSI